MDAEETFVTMDIPLFVPTAAGEMSAMASIPSSGTVQGPAVGLLPAMEAERVRLDVLRDIAHALAERGQPVISFDYPGSGMSPSQVPREEVTSVLSEACDWFLEQTGSTELALTGSCFGGRLALAIAARNQSVSTVVAQAIIMKLRTRRVQSRVRAGIAALDVVGPRVTAPLTRGSSVRYSETEWDRELVDDITGAARNAHVHLVFGEQDPGYRDFIELTGSNTISPEVAQDLEVSVFPGEPLNVLTNPAQQVWFRDIAERSLSTSREVKAAR